jgi:hypothetical protein
MEMSKKWRSRDNPEQAGYGKHYEITVQQYPMGKRRASGVDLPAQSRSVSSMQSPAPSPDGELWIKEAIGKPGSYRASVMRRYGKKGFTERGTIKRSVIAKDAKEPGKIGQQARLARTLKTF